MASKGNKALQKLSGNSLSTKELARSLGLVKKKPSSSYREKGQENKAKAGQCFAYLIVLDFESTCWKDKKLNYGPEIIEFPAVLLNTSSGVLESEFHMFVQPSEHGKLSEFCTELTGITQPQVDDAVPIGTCLMLFGRWLRETRDAKSIKFPCDLVQKKGQEQTVEIADKLCTFVTWSDWDLGNCLKNECYRKQLRMPQPMRSWIDLRATYKNFYSRKPQGLAGALQDLGIQFTGREHSGLDDARNTARLAWRMISDGCLMQITKSLDGVEEKLWSDFLKTFHSPIQDGNSGQCDKSARIVAYRSNNNPIFESLNFSTPRTRISRKPGADEITEGKRKSTALETFCSKAKMRKIKQKLPDLRGNILVNNRQERIIRENKTPQDIESLSLKRVADTVKACSALSNASNEKDNMENKKMAVQDFGCVVSTNKTITSLLSPITSLTSGSKDHYVSHLKGETFKACTSGFKIRSGLVKQSVCHNQNMPLSGHNLRSSNDIGRKEESSYDHPCKASNIEPFTSNIPLFRLPLIDESISRGLDKTLNPKASLVVKRTTTVSTSGNETFAPSYSARTNNLIKTFTSHPVKTPPVSLPVNCFNRGRTTPPLCYCGRRTRRKSVVNPGPNQGRAFYSCSANHDRCKSTLTVGQKAPKAGCNFFRWEVRL